MLRWRACLSERLFHTALWEAELKTGLESEVALVIVARSEVVAEPRQEVIELRDPNSNLLIDRNVNSATNDKIPRVV